MKKRVKIIAAISGIPLVIVFFLAGCALREFGQTPQDLSAYKDLPYFADVVFHSPEPTSYYPDRIGLSAPWRMRTAALPCLHLSWGRN